MPELPEVETVVRDLRPHLLGQRLLAVHRGKLPLRRPWNPQWEPLLLQRTIQAVSRRGKWIVLDLEAGLHLVVHLGMTGQLTIAEAKEPLRDHVHLVLDLEQGWQLRFRDVRRFGSITLVEDRAALEEFFRTAGLGPEPWELDAGSWRQRLAGTGRNLKAVLLDQGIVSGVGNIYADESLFEARLHPATPANALGPRRAGRLLEAIRRVLQQAIQLRGSTIRDYIGGSGLQGGFQDEFRVYGRTGLPCLACAAPIRQTRLAGRSSHFCPRCQRKR